MVSAGPRMTRATVLVLRAFLETPDRELYGLEITRIAELASGTIHPILARLEGCGWLESSWEELGQAAVGRPRRRFYKLTPDGAVGAVRALNRVGARDAAASAARVRPGLAEGGLT